MFAKVFLAALLAVLGVTSAASRARAEPDALPEEAPTPDDYETSLRLGRENARRGRYEDAVAPLRQAIQLRPDVTYNYVQLADVYCRLKRPEEAAALARGLLSRGKGDLQAHAAAVRIFEQAGDLPGALEASREAVRLTRSSSEKNVRRLHLANLLEASDLWDEAESVYREVAATAVDPSAKAMAEEGIRRSQASVYRYDPDILKLIVAAESQTQFQQQRNQALRLVKFCQDKKQFGRAREMVQAEIERAPKKVALRVLLAELETGDARHGAAVEAYERALEIVPNDRSMIAFLARSCRVAGDFRKEIEYTRRLIEVHGGASHWLTLAQAYARLGEDDKAMECVREYRKRAGNSVGALYQLARLYATMGHVDRAIDTMKEAIEKHPSASSYHYYYLGGLCQQGGRHEEARAAALQVLEFAELHRNYRDWAERQVTVRAETPQGAQAVLEELEIDIRRIEASPDSGAQALALATRHALRGQIFAFRGEPDAAIAAYTKASRLAPVEKDYSGQLRRLRIERQARQDRISASLDDESILWKIRDDREPTRWWLAAENTIVTVDTQSGEKQVWLGVLGLSAFKPTCIAFGEEAVWVGSEQGVFLYDRRHKFWSLVSANRFSPRDGEIVERIELGRDGHAILTLSVSGGKRREVRIPPP